MSVQPAVDYPNYKKSATVLAPIYVRVSLEHLKNLLRDDAKYAQSMLDWSPYTFDSGKLAHYQRAFETSMAIERPCLTYRNNQLLLSEGRHRLYALEHGGYTHVEVEFEAPLQPILEPLLKDA